MSVQWFENALARYSEEAGSSKFFVRTEYPMKRITSFRIGGNADLAVYPADAKAFAFAVSKAKEMEIPVLVCAQLSRGTEAKGGSHRPALSDLRESGSIEQDADIVLFMYRDIYYKNEKTDPNVEIDEHKAECIVAKNRHGGLETVPLYWDGMYTRFSTLDGQG